MKGRFDWKVALFIGWHVLRFKVLRSRVMVQFTFDFVRE